MEILNNKYMIKEAAKLLSVEPHVLRYWEEELELNIERNEMGHRYYSEKDIRLLKEVKRLKENGISLKAIRNALKKNTEINTSDNNTEDMAEKEAAGAAEVISSDLETQNRVVDFKMAQLQAVMNRAVLSAINSGLNEVIRESVEQAVSDNMKSQISEIVIKQMDTVMREQEERAEERYKKDIYTPLLSPQWGKVQVEVFNAFRAAIDSDENIAEEDRLALASKFAEFVSYRRKIKPFKTANSGAHHARLACACMRNGLSAADIAALMQTAMDNEWQRWNIDSEIAKLKRGIREKSNTPPPQTDLDPSTFGVPQGALNY